RIRPSSPRQWNPTHHRPGQDSTSKTAQWSREKANRRPSTLPLLLGLWRLSSTRMRSVSAFSWGGTSERAGSIMTYAPRVRPRDILDAGHNPAQDPQNSATMGQIRAGAKTQICLVFQGFAAGEGKPSAQWLLGQSWRRLRPRGRGRHWLDSHAGDTGLLRG